MEKDKGYADMKRELLDMKFEIIIFLLVIIFFVGFIGWGVILEKDNAKIWNKTIIITGKICHTSLSNNGQIQDENEVLYFIPSNQCNDYIIGETTNISYNRIHQMTFGNASDYNIVVGDY